MQNTLNTLRLVEKLSDGVPVPFLKPVIRVTLHIAETAENVKQMQEQCRQLAERAARFTLALYDHLRTSSSTSNSTAEHLATLLCTLEEIEVFMRRQGKRSFLSTFAHQSRLTDDLSRLTARLDDGFRIFSIQSALYTSERMDSISDTQYRLLRHADDADRVGAMVLSTTGAIETRLVQLSQACAMQDGTMKLFGREDVELLDELGHEFQWPSSVDHADEPVVRYRAKLRPSGSAVVVRRFPRADERFAVAVNMSKRVWHPYIVETLGYSRPDPYQAFIVQEANVMSGYGLVESLSKLEGTTRLRFLTQCISQLSSAFDFMEKNGLRSPSSQSDIHMLFPPDLCLRPDGRLQWDLSSWSMPVLPGAIDLFQLANLRSIRFTSDQNYTLKQLLFHASQHTDRLCRKYWDGIQIPFVGQCVRLSHPCFPLLWDPTATSEWSTTGPGRYPCPCKARRVARPPLMTYGSGKGCERQRILGEDELRKISFQVEEEVEACGTSQEGGETVVLANGWRRHTVCRDNANRVLAFTLELAGHRHWKDVSRWFMEDVIDKVSYPVAEDIGLVMRVRIYMITGLLPEGLDDATDPGENARTERFGDRANVPDRLYFCEDWARERVSADDGRGFRMPLGYWSTSPDDVPASTEEPGMVDERALYEKRGLVLRGVTRERETIWMQTVGEMQFVFETRTVVDTCHLSDDECMLIKEIRGLGEDPCRPVTASIEEAEDNP